MLYWNVIYTSSSYIANDFETLPCLGWVLLGPFEWLQSQWYLHWSAQLQGQTAKKQEGLFLGTYCHYPPWNYQQKHPENAWLEDDPFRFGMAYFQGRTVTFREGTFYNPHFHRIPMVVNGSNSRLDMDIGRAAESARVTSSRCPDSSGAVYL